MGPSVAACVAFGSSRHCIGVRPHSWMHHCIRRYGHTAGRAGYFCWEYRTPTPAHYSVLGTGCGNTHGVPTLTTALGAGPSRTGSRFDVDLHGAPTSSSAFMATGFSSTSWAGQALPIDLSSSGAPGCFLRCEAFVWFPFALGPSAVPRWSLANPATLHWPEPPSITRPSLSAAGANSLGAIFSEARAATIGVFSRTPRDTTPSHEWFGQTVHLGDRKDLESTYSSDDRPVGGSWRLLDWKGRCRELAARLGIARGAMRRLPMPHPRIARPSDGGMVALRG